VPKLNSVSFVSLVGVAFVMSLSVVGDVTARALTTL
jgi:hypothetical protein